MFHLRFTPDDISGYTFNFLEKFESYIVARELLDDEGNPLLHYHILIDTTYGAKSIRDLAKAELKIPQSGKGKNNKYYALIPNWEDPAYICKYDDIICSKGFTEKQILDYAVAGKAKYLDKQRVATSSASVLASKDPPKLPFQQAVIASAAADWYNYKRDNTRIDTNALKKFVCDAMRTHGKGINIYMVKELSYAVLYDDLDYRDYVLNKIEI